jgi:hypothetical protein
MKRILTLILVLSAIGAVQAQGTEGSVPERYMEQQLDLPEIDGSWLDAYLERRATQRAETVNGTRGSIAKYNVAFIDAVANAGSAPGLIRTTLWPDSTVRIADPDGDFFWFIHAYADVFDPSSTLINDLYIEDNLSVEFGEGKEYDVDSVGFYFLYGRVTPPSIVDTLRVYVFGNGNISLGTYSDFPAPGDETTVTQCRYKSSNFAPQSAILQEYEILLTEADTSSLIRRRGLPLDLDLGEGGRLGIAFHFLPGQSYSLGDVLFDNATGSLVDVNSFDVITYEEDDGLYPISAAIDAGALNQGGVLFSESLYQISTLGWNPFYYPTFLLLDGWGSEHALTEWVLGPIGAHYISGTTGTPCEIQFSDLSNVDGITTWLWDFGDGSISLDQNPTYLYADNGAYAVTLEVRDGGGETYTYERNVVVNNCGTGVEPISALQSFSVFPNPASSIINLDLTLSNPLEMDMAIFNSTGELVQNHLIQAGVQFTNSYDVSNLPAGFYTIKLQNGNQVATKGFMIAE